MCIQQGRALKYGDTIGLTAPAGPVDRLRLKKAIAALGEMGFRVKVGLTCYENYRGYLAGPAKMRAEELMSMFTDRQVKAVLCLRGGYGSPQLLDLLDYECIKENPKLFIGYSDVTALHIAFQQNCHLATIHGPMAASDLIDADDFTKQSLLTLLMNEQPDRLLLNPGDMEIECLVSGEAEGMLTGGNLSLISALMGTPYEIDVKGKILFLEDVGEDRYKLDRMLTQLALSGKLSDAAGIILGTWTGCGGEEESREDKLYELFNRIISPFQKPAIYHVQAGHCKPMLSLPFGLRVHIHAERKEVRVQR